MSRKNNTTSFLLTMAICCILLFVGYKLCAVDLSEDNSFETCKAKILAITEENDSSYSIGDETISAYEIVFSAKLLNGEEKGKTVQASQQIDGMYAMPTEDIRAGDVVLLIKEDYAAYPSQDIDAPEWSFVSVYRLTPLIFLAVAFFLIILILGRLKGFKTVVSLVITCMSIFAVYIPATLKGYNVYLMTMIVAAFMIISSLVLLNGINRKTLCAILGNVSGVLISALLCLVMHHVLRLTGLINENYIYLQMLNPDKPIDLLAVAWGGAVIGSLGAIMDIAMSIASSIHELSEHMQNKTFHKLFRSGMNIGKDAIGTMTNTLILAYIGSSFALVLLLVAYHSDLTYLLNTEMITAEITQSLVGSIGVLIAVPITASIGAHLAMRKKHPKRLKGENI